MLIFANTFFYVARASINIESSKNTNTRDGILNTCPYFEKGDFYTETTKELLPLTAWNGRERGASIQTICVDVTSGNVYLM